MTVLWELVRGGTISPAQDEPWRPPEVSGWWRGGAQKPHLRLLPHFTETVPLSHLDDSGGQPPAPAPESPEVRRRALAAPPVLFF